MRHYDVQIVGGISLFEGHIAEMQTGEGKTLTATLPLYLHSLVGKGAHLATVNDYLAKRDAEWMMPLFEMLGVSVGIIQTPDDQGSRGGRRTLLRSRTAPPKSSVSISCVTACCCEHKTASKPKCSAVVTAGSPTR